MSRRSIERFFETHDGVRLHVILHPNAAGPTAAPIVLLHGGGANAHWWDHLAEPLCRFGPVHALDFRGHGDSEYPATRVVGAFNDDLEALLADLGREDAILIGHSLGAAVALDHASRFGATRGLVLVDLARGGNPETGRRARLALAFRRSYRSREEAVERFRFLPESSRASETLRAHIARHSVREEPNGRFGYKFDPAWFGLPSRPRPDLESVRCRTLLIRGSESALLTADAARAFVAELPAADWIEIPGAGHHVLVDRPDALQAILVAFLTETAASPGDAAESRAHA